MSLADELLPTVEPQRKAGRPTTTVREDDVFAAVHRIPILDVLAWLGIETDQQGSKTIVKCPRCGAFDDTSSAVIGNGVKCLHQTCSDAGPVSAPGLRTAIDLTMLVRSISKPIDAVRELAEAFNIPMQERAATRPAPAAQRPTDPTEDAPPEGWSDPEALPDTLPERSAEILSMAQLLMPVWQEMQASGTTRSRGIPTGNAELDQAIGGYRAGNVTILGAKRSFGKTSFSLLSIDTAIDEGCRVLAFGGEDSPAMYGRRFMARRSGVNATLLRDMREPFTGVQLDRALRAVSEASNVPFFVNAIGMPAERIAAIITETVGGDMDPQKRWLVVVDYLQCVPAQRQSKDRRIELTYIAKTLTSAIKNSGGSGLLLSQLKRSEKRRPEVEDLKESGDLEDAAEHILLGHRDHAQGTAGQERRLLIIGKNKDGIDDLPDIELRFDAQTASFVRTRDRGREEPFRSGSWSPDRNAPPPPRDPREQPERDAGPGPDDYGIPDNFNDFPGQL